MPLQSFLFICLYIHFLGTAKHKSKGDKDYDPLFMIRHVMQIMMDHMKACWVAGDRVAIDENMIQYMGWAVSFVQYMPYKPIKHGIKVFTICCAYSAVLLGFEVYCGAEDDDASNTDKSALAVVQRLLE